MTSRDDLGVRIELAHAPQRVISLVPSLTETLFALGLKREIVGVTKFCPVPAATAASIPKVGGTKNPDLRRILALAPDLVIANAEENRRAHVEWLRDHGIAVFVTYPRTVSGAIDSLIALGDVVGRQARAAALALEIAGVVRRVENEAGQRRTPGPRVFCPVWKTPWITFNADTYAHDVLRLMGFTNVFAAAGARYPRTTLAEVRRRQPDVILLPDEPYAFTAEDAAELGMELAAPSRRRALLINGRDLHWYGVHMVRGLPALAERLRPVRGSRHPQTRS